MRFSKFYTLLIVLVGSVAWALPYQLTRDTLSFSSGMGVVKFAMAIDKASFDLKIALMKKQMESISTAVGRLELMRKTLSEIQEAREKKPMLDDDVEIYMSLIVHSLGDLPPSDQFDKKYCSFYQTQMLSNYEPTALNESGGIGEPQDPAIIESLSVMKKICE